MISEENSIFNIIKNQIQPHCILFNERQFILLLQLKLNDIDFLKSIQDISLTLKLNYFKEIVEEYNLNVSIGKEYLNKVFDEQSVMDKLTEYFIQLDKLHNTFIDNHDTEKFDKIRENLGTLESSIQDISSSYNDQSKQLKDEILKRIYSFKNELEAINEVFVSDRNNLFIQNKLWDSKFGNYSNNLFIKKNKDYEDETANFKSIFKCKYLNNSKYSYANNKIFSPLVFMDKFYISLDGRSISCYAPDLKEVSKVELNDDIIFSGSIFHFHDTHFILVPGKFGIYICNDNEIVWKMNYKFTMTDEYEVKSISLYNNFCYVNIENYEEKFSYVYVIRYDFIQKKFFCRTTKTIKPKIVSNICIVYNYDTESPQTVYFTEDYKCNIVDSNSFDVLSKHDVSDLPIELKFKYSNMIKKFSYPIISYDEKLFYTSIDRQNSLKICIFDLIDKELKILNCPQYTQINEEYLLPSITNIIVSENDVMFGGFMHGEYCKVNYDAKKEKNYIQVRQRLGRKKNNQILGYLDKIICLDNEKYQKHRWIGLWQNRLIIMLDKENDYEIFIESKGENE